MASGGGADAALSQMPTACARGWTGDDGHRRRIGQGAGGDGQRWRIATALA